MKRITPETLPKLFPIGHAFCEAAYHPGGFAENKFAEVWKSLLAADVGVVFYEEENGIVSGIFGGVFSPDMFSGRMVAVENFWFVLPHKRGGSLALRLLKAFEDEAKARKCERIVMVTLEALSPESVSKIFTRRGYSVLEHSYAKEI